MQMSLDSGPIILSLALFLGVLTGCESLVVGAAGHGWALSWVEGSGAGGAVAIRLSLALFMGVLTESESLVVGGAGDAVAIMLSLALFLGVLTGSDSLVVGEAGHGWEAGCGAGGAVAGAGHESNDWALCCCLCMKICLSHSNFSTVKIRRASDRRG